MNAFWKSEYNPTHEASFAMAINIRNLNHSQLNELIQRAKARQDELVKEKATKLRDKISALVKAEGFELDDVFGGAGGRRGVRRKVKPKYRNPADGSQTWTGRGKRPRWYSAALAAGKKEKDLLIG
jgi:DNA-binding protein H-NS